MSLATSIGLKSLLAAQAGLENVGHNLANANTPGYSRQTLVNSSSAPIQLGGLLRGTGLQMGVIQRTVDTLLHARIARQVSAVGRSEARLSALSEVEALLGNGGGAQTLLQNFYATLSSLSASPSDSVLRGSVVQSSTDLAGELREVSSRVQGLTRDVINSAEILVDQANGLATEINELNRRIRDLEFSGGSANDLRDRRDQAVQELSKLVDSQVIENADGSVSVLVGGKQLVGPGNVRPLTMSVQGASGPVSFALGDSSHAVVISGGALGGLSSFLQNSAPGLGQELDAFARNLILEVNRVHSTGIGAKGPFTQLVGTNALLDQDGDGDRLDELLSGSGLPFEVEDGALYVSITQLSSGQMERTKIDIDKDTTSVGSFLAAINALGSVSAKLDGQGHVRLAAASGYGFDFSAGVDPNPDPEGAFGGAHASLASAASGPFAVNALDTLQWTGPIGTFNVTLPVGSIAQNGQASAAELAAALNADAQFVANGLNAKDIGGRLVVQTVGAGASNAFTFVGGSAAAALGWTPGTAVQGSDTSVDVQLGGAYSGANGTKLTFQALSDGVVGTTPNLLVQVFDETGAQLTQLDLGQGYVPGSEIQVAPGVWAKFGLGSLSATNGDFFEVDLVADADTSDVLVALGVNGLFVGSDAATIDINPDIAAAPELLAAALNAGGGDAQNLLRLLELDTKGLESLGGGTLGEQFAEIVNGLGLEIQGEDSALEAEQFVLDGLQSKRDQISGVNVDEELVRMVEQEQAFAAAAEFLRVVNELSSELMNIL